MISGLLKIILFVGVVSGLLTYIGMKIAEWRE